MIEFLGTCVAAAATIVCAIIAYRSNKEAKIAKEERERAELRAKRRLQESRLSLKLINANCALTVGTALAVKRGHANGELDDGLKQVAEAQKAYNEFIQQVALEDVVGEEDY